jgi:hypothetical protein
MLRHTPVLFEEASLFPDDSMGLGATDETIKD